jgi:hypothetical protein
MRADKIIAKDNQVIGIGKRKRTQQNSLDDRKDGSRRADSDASIRIAVSVNPGDLRNWRKVYWTSITVLASPW